MHASPDSSSLLVKPLSRVSSDTLATLRVTSGKTFPFLQELPSNSQQYPDSPQLYTLQPVVSPPAHSLAGYVRTSAADLTKCFSPLLLTIASQFHLSPTCWSQLRKSRNELVHASRSSTCGLLWWGLVLSRLRTRFPLRWGKLNRNSYMTSFPAWKAARQWLFMAFRVICTPLVWYSGVWGRYHGPKLSRWPSHALSFPKK